MQTLILVYSRSGETMRVAQQLQQLTHAALQPVTVPAGTFPDDMNATADTAAQQIQSGHLPPLAAALPALDSVQRLVVGGPVWAGTVATPVRSLLTQLGQFTGQVVPLFTDVGMSNTYQADFQRLLGRPVPAGLEVADAELADLDTLQQKLRTWWQTL